MFSRSQRKHHVTLLTYSFAFISCIVLIVIPGWAVTSDAPKLALTPPMGWNDWAHYQCNFTANTILANANALVKTGLASHGYNTVTIDDCWMQKDRDIDGNLQVDVQRFPQGIKPVADAIHRLGLKFGIYEDAGYATCGGFAGSGDLKGGSKNHFVQDTKLFASWGVDYLKLDGCNVYVPPGTNSNNAYRRAYAQQSAALKTVDRPIIFSESAPAYFQDTPDWYDTLTWVRYYGQLWREGTDIDTYDTKKPEASRFDSVLWNYAYNLPLGRFQKPNNWNDADFIIGGDRGMTLAETRSQVALWSMMSAPLILSSDLEQVNPQSVSILGNTEVIAVDQDALGKMAILIRRTRDLDILLKPLTKNDYAAAVLNRGNSSVKIIIAAADLGFTVGKGCSFATQNLWSGQRQYGVHGLDADVAPHDTAIWRIHPASSCGNPKRSGAITMIADGKSHDIAVYSRCMAASGRVGTCTGGPEESWTVTASSGLKSEGKCLTNMNDKLVMRPCFRTNAQHWTYSLQGNIVGIDQKCLTRDGSDPSGGKIAMQKCGHNQLNQIWSLPN